jgi:outer membrane protein assembly factor BamB
MLPFKLIIILLLFSGWDTSKADDWPNWMGSSNDGIWHEEGILKKFPENGARYVWKFPIGKGYTGPAVVGGKLYVMDRVESPQEERPKSDPSEEDDQDKAATGISEIPGKERVYCLNAKTGKEVWRYEYDCVYRISYPEGPRTTPLVDGRFVYTLGAMGDLICLDHQTGRLVWKKNLPQAYSCKPPVWGFAAHPRIFGERLVCIVGGENSAVVCFNKHDGKEIWKSGNAKEVGYAPPVPMTLDGTTHLVYWSDIGINGIDLRTGQEKWSVAFPEVPPTRPTVTIMTPQIFENKILVSNFYNGSMVVEVSAAGESARKLWSTDPKKNIPKDGLNVLMGSPIIREGRIYGFAGKGEMRCLELETGKQVWEDKRPANSKRDSYFATAFITQNQDRYFIFNDQGELIIASLNAGGYREVDRTAILEPSSFVRGRNVVWSHPAYAERCLFVRNSKELVCVDLSE